MIVTVPCTWVEVGVRTVVPFRNSGKPCDLNHSEMAFRQSTLSSLGQGFGERKQGFTERWLGRIGSAEGLHEAILLDIGFDRGAAWGIEIRIIVCGERC
jgi:hypothetical protein